MKKLSLLCAPLLCLTLAGCGPRGETGGGTSVASGTPVASASTPMPQVKLTPGQIKAGVGIEGVSLGQPRAAVEKTLGKPEDVDANEFAPGQTYALYYSKGIELSFGNDKLEMITLHAPPEAKWTAAYTGATEQGFGVGSSADEIVKALGEPQPGMARALRYPKLGIWFRLDADRDDKGKTPRVESVQVMKPEPPIGVAEVDAVTAKKDTPVFAEVGGKKEKIGTLPAGSSVKFSADAGDFYEVVVWAGGGELYLKKSDAERGDVTPTLPEESVSRTVFARIIEAEERAINETPVGDTSEKSAIRKANLMNKYKLEYVNKLGVSPLDADEAANKGIKENWPPH